MIHYLVSLVALAIIASWTMALGSGSSNHVVFPDNSTLHGIPYKEWIVKWWQWWLGIPHGMHPGEVHPDAKRCSALQDGPVWFLPSASPDGNVTKYQCDIPSGKDIMVYLSSSECEIGGMERLLTDEEIKTCAFNIKTPLNNINAILDNTTIGINRLGDVIKTDFFNVTYPHDPLSIYGEGIKPGTYRAVGSGYFIFLHDLPPGKHILKTVVNDILEGKMTPEPTATALIELNIK